MAEETPDIPFKSPSLPKMLTGESQLKFRCHTQVSCFNACCRRADVTLAPYDVVRLKNRLGLGTAEFLKDYTAPFQMDQDGMPGIKLRTDDDGVCKLLDGDRGCSVYEDRPTVCRYYPVGLLNIREKDSPEAKQNYSLVKEDHCKGHEEDQLLTIDEYRKQQGCVQYDDFNREWYELILKKKSAGPAVGKPSEMSLQLFFMASYNLDMFRKFVLSPNFRDNYDLDEEIFQQIEQDELYLMRFAYRFMRQVLFGERTIDEKPNAWEKRVEERKDIWKAQEQAAIEANKNKDDLRYDGSCEL